MKEAFGESQGTLPNKVKFFKGLLRSKVNKASIERDGTKRTQKERVSRLIPAGWNLQMVIKKGIEAGELGLDPRTAPHFGEGSFQIRREKRGHHVPKGKTSYILTVINWGPWADKEKQEPPEWQETTFGGDK